MFIWCLWTWVSGGRVLYLVKEYGNLRGGGEAMVEKNGAAAAGKNLHRRCVDTTGFINQ